MKNEINEAHDYFENSSDKISEVSKRKAIVPGEIIVTGEDYLPGVYHLCFLPMASSKAMAIQTSVMKNEYASM